MTNIYPLISFTPPNLHSLKLSFKISCISSGPWFYLLLHQVSRCVAIFGVYICFWYLPFGAGKKFYLYLQQNLTISSTQEVFNYCVCVCVQKYINKLAYGKIKILVCIHQSIVNVLCNFSCSEDFFQ